MRKKIVENSDSIDEFRLSRVLAGELETTVLTAAEKAVWSERFLAKMSEPGPGEEAFFAELRKSGGAVGLDSSGNVVHVEAEASER
jgi:hypothetical protein